jgi:hypothetical protein
MDARMSDPEDVVKALLSPAGSPEVFTLSVSQFRQVFGEIQKQAQGTPVDVVLNEDWAMVQFSRLCNHRVRVLRDFPSRAIQRFFSRFLPRRMLTENDFEFASLYAEFHGGTTRLSFGSFIGEELSTNWLPLLFTLLISWGAFQALMLAAPPTPKEALEKINELLLTAATLYLSIFILFTVSQNVELIRDPYLFRKGLTHRFFRVDRLLASFSIVVLCLSILNVVLLNLPSPVSFTVLGRTMSMQDTSAVVPFLSAAGVTVLTDCFLALVRYYFRSVRYVTERQLTKELLDELWKERNTKQRR